MRFSETHTPGSVYSPDGPNHTVFLECDSSRGHLDKHVYKVVEPRPSECLLRG